MSVETACSRLCPPKSTDSFRPTLRCTMVRHTPNSSNSTPPYSRGGRGLKGGLLEVNKLTLWSGNPINEDIQLTAPVTTLPLVALLAETKA